MLSLQLDVDFFTLKQDKKSAIALDSRFFSKTVKLFAILIIKRNRFSTYGLVRFRLHFQENK
jgi:hypothetical protein